MAQVEPPSAPSPGTRDAQQTLGAKSAQQKSSADASAQRRKRKSKTRRSSAGATSGSRMPPPIPTKVPPTQPRQAAQMQDKTPTTLPPVPSTPAESTSALQPETTAEPLQIAGDSARREEYLVENGTGNSTLQPVVEAHGSTENVRSKQETTKWMRRLQPELQKVVRKVALKRPAPKDSLDLTADLLLGKDLADGAAQVPMETHVRHTTSTASLLSQYVMPALENALCELMKSDGISMDDDMQSQLAFLAWQVRAWTSNANP